MLHYALPVPATDALTHMLCLWHHTPALVSVLPARMLTACHIYDLQDADYGKHRLWASVSWGGLSTLAGAMNSKLGIQAGFLAYTVISVPCMFIAWWLIPHTAQDKCYDKVSELRINDYCIHCMG